MGGEALTSIREAVINQGIIPVELNVEYRVIYNTLQGNMPVNDRIHGSILDIPIDLRLEYTTMPNTYGTFPVNNKFEGIIGDTPINGRMAYTMMYSTIAGNFPVNTGIDFTIEGKQYHLDMPTKYALGRSRGSDSGGQAGGGTVGKAKKFVTAKFIAGKMVQPEDQKDTSGGGMSYEVHRPICGGIEGTIEDVTIDLRFSNTYYTNTSSGRSPINNLLTGELRSAA